MKNLVNNCKRVLSESKAYSKKHPVLTVLLGVVPCVMSLIGFLVAGYMQYENYCLEKELTNRLTEGKEFINKHKEFFNREES